LKRGEILGVVGESGCGKTVTGRSIIRLLSEPQATTPKGAITYRPREGEPLDVLSLQQFGKEMCALRGKEIAMIFQEPMTSLTPVYTIGKQIMEKILTHSDVDKAEARAQALQMLKRVGIPAPEQRIDEYPHQMSGGMRQRVMIAIALACDPQVLIADEPTTALDVTVQAQILALMHDLKTQMNSSIVLITHDLGVIGEMADHVAVMYMGRVVEYTDSVTLFTRPRHPYTRGLFKSIPLLTKKDSPRLEPISGTVPEPYAVPTGCPFRTRCPHAMPICEKHDPPPTPTPEGGSVRCWLYNDADPEGNE
ncbi:MAG: ABC transporter ATP-binding protein, partial [Spirochaetaceae bacterium]